VGRHLARLLCDATIVSPESSMLFTPLLAEVAAGAIGPRHVIVPLREMCPKADVLRGRAAAWDETAQTVTVETNVGLMDVSTDSLSFGTTQTHYGRARRLRRRNHATSVGAQPS
jgi:NADH dehydrogenase FAD-containing subunit